MPPPPPPAPPPIDPELLVELGALSTDDLCRRLEVCLRVEHEQERLLGTARKVRAEVGRYLAGRLDLEHGRSARVVDGIAYRAHRDRLGIERTAVGGGAS